MQPSVTHVEGVAVPFANPNGPTIISVIQHDPVTVTETLNAQMVETQRAFEASQSGPYMTVPELTADIAHHSAAQAPQRGLADSVGWGRNDGNTDHIRKATEEARQATALFNTQNNVRSTDYAPFTAEPMVTRSFEVQATGPVTYRESDLTPISYTTDAVLRRKKMVDGMYKGMSLHDNSVNGAIRTMALQNRSGPRYDGSRAQTLMTTGNTDVVPSGTKYQLTVGKNQSFNAPTRSVTVPKKNYDDVNIIRTELAKEDMVLHPAVPLPAFTQNTRAETNAFATRAWSPLRR